MRKIDIFSVMNKALYNELSVDKYDLNNLFPGRLFGIIPPRPIILMQKIKNDSILLLGLAIISLLWIIIFPLLTVYKFFKYLFLINGNIHDETIGSNLWIGTGDKIPQLHKGFSKDVSPNHILVVPWIKIANKLDSDDLKKIDMLNYLSVLDLIKAFWFSIVGAVKWAIFIKRPVNVLQEYILFDFFLLSIVLEKVKNQGVDCFWYINHYDRWAVLIDSVSESKNVMVQHGYLNSSFNFPYKNKNLKKVFVLDEVSIDIFKKNINCSNTKIIYEILGSTISLREISNAEKSILIISRPVQIEFDVSLILAILNTELDLKVYIKPHPKFDKNPYRNYFSKYEKCYLIEDSDFFPKVSLVISGYSTLAIEYELKGVKVIWIAEETIESILAKVEKHIR